MPINTRFPHSLNDRNAAPSQVHLRNSVRYVTLSLRARRVPGTVPPCPPPHIAPPRDEHMDEPGYPLHLAFPIADLPLLAPAEIPGAPPDERLNVWIGRGKLVGGSVVCALALWFTFAPDSMSSALSSLMSRSAGSIAGDLVRRGYGPLIGYVGVSALCPRLVGGVMWVVSRLPVFVLVRFPVKYLSLLPPRALERLPNATIERLSISTIEQLTPARISLLSPSTIARLSAATIARLPPAITTTLRLTLGTRMHLRFLCFRLRVDGLALSVASFLPWISVDIVIALTRLVVSFATFSTPLIICMLVYRFFG